MTDYSFGAPVVLLVGLLLCVAITTWLYRAISPRMAAAKLNRRPVPKWLSRVEVNLVRKDWSTVINEITAYINKLENAGSYTEIGKGEDSLSLLLFIFSSESKKLGKTIYEIKDVERSFDQYISAITSLKKAKEHRSSLSKKYKNNIPEWSKAELQANMNKLLAEVSLSKSAAISACEIFVRAISGTKEENSNSTLH